MYGQFNEVKIIKRIYEKYDFPYGPSDMKSHDFEKRLTVRIGVAEF